MDVSRAARIVAVMGASGSGKSAWVKAQLAAERPTRLLVVDPEGEYGALAPRVASLAQLVPAVRASAFRCSFVPSFDHATGIRQFALLCDLAWHAAQSGPVTFVADELHEFVTATEAPATWRRLVKRGRKHGLTVYAIAQRPAAIDKGLWSNASMVRSGRLNYADDQRVIAAALSVPPARVEALAGLDWIARDRNTGALTDGTLTFRPAGRPEKARRARP